VTLRDDPPDYDAAERAAREYAQQEGALYLSPYNHPDVIAGAGTAALEILDVLPSLDVLVVPLGGGGLASGLGTVINAAAPRVRVVGVEAAASTPFAASRRAGQIAEIDAKTSLADGLTGNLESGSITFDIVQRVVDDLVAVDEDEIAHAIRALAAEEHLIAEGAGAVAAAAVLAKQVVRAGETAVVMLTGANIDAERLARLLSR
jgi:threonine dehydratase